MSGADNNAAIRFMRADRTGSRPGGRPAGAEVALAARDARGARVSANQTRAKNVNQLRGKTVVRYSSALSIGVGF